MRLYWAAPLFSQVARKWNRAVSGALAEEIPDLTVVLPQDFRAEGRFNDRRYYGRIHRRCLIEIRRADAVVAVLDGADVDSGTAFEVGYAAALGIPVIGLRTDYRPGADHGVNLMVARACTYLVREFAFQEEERTVARALGRRLRRLREREAEAEAEAEGNDTETASSTRGG
jgi:nucleoside 2-deoxyribosyltransferase